MESAAEQRDLLEAICTLGDRMGAALAEDDLEAFLALTQERQRLIAALDTAGHPAEPDPDWQQTAERLAAQHKVLSEALQAKQQAMVEALARLHQIREARHRYAAPSAAPGILRQDLRG